MKYRTLAGTDINVSEIGFWLGTLVTGRWGRFTEFEATALLHRALDLGVNFFVSADVDAEGAGEELLAKAFRSQREEITIAVKVGYDFYHAHARLHSSGKPSVQFTPEYIRFAVDKALQRLKCERIDLLQLHDVTLDAIQHQELQGALALLKQAGKIRHDGVALGPGSGWLEEAQVAVHRDEPTVIEHLHHLLEPANGLAITAEAYREEVGKVVRFSHGLMPQKPKHSVSFIVRGPHASGLLEGRLTTDTVFKPDDARNQFGPDWLHDGLERAERFKFLTGKDTGRTLAQAALLWHLAEPSLASCLPNIASREDLDEFAGASEKNALTPDELRQVEDLQRS
jgi:aryl-alcohol dehydrogenase-like predicted oxidoreductase